MANKDRYLELGYTKKEIICAEFWTILSHEYTKGSIPVDSSFWKKQIEKIEEDYHIIEDKDLLLDGNWSRSVFDILVGKQRFIRSAEKVGKTYTYEINN